MKKLADEVDNAKPDFAALIEKYKLLGEKPRFDIFRILLQHPDGISGVGIAAELKKINNKYPQPTISRHLGILFAGGVVSFKWVGKEKRYRVNEAGRELFPAVLRHWHSLGAAMPAVGTSVDDILPPPPDTQQFPDILYLGTRLGEDAISRMLGTHYQAGRVKFEQELPAIRMLRSRPPKLVILDWMDPGEAVSFIKRLKSEASGVQILAIGDVCYSSHFIETGADCYIKPQEAQQVGWFLDEALGPSRGDGRANR